MYKQENSCFLYQLARKLGQGLDTDARVRMPGHGCQDVSARTWPLSDTKDSHPDWVLFQRKLREHCKYLCKFILFLNKEFKWVSKFKK